MHTPFYITTPIYYVNARPHLGHAYTTIAADVACRFNKMCEKDTYFLTGTDEHGDKIVLAAMAENLSPRNYVDKISGLFRNLWPELNIEYNDFIRTTDKAHMAIVEQLLQKIYDQGDIYFSEYEGQYCFGCERFYTDRELVEGKCPDHQTAPEKIKEANYFFRMSKYQDWLIDHIRKNPDFIRPERYKNEVLAFLREPLEDLCISRPKSRLKWGITLPFDHNYVTYVWFDALVNYISALGYPDGEKFKRYWPKSQHIIAKDILKPHGIYWPIMLKASGIEIYNHLNVHGYWNIEQSKMSKSLGNVVEPLSLKNTYGLDAFRFFLMRDMVFGLDSNFSESALVNRINADLANDLGNLFSRVVAMTHKFFKGEVPQIELDSGAEDSFSLKLDAMNAVSEFEKEMGNFAFHKALISVWKFVGQMNKYIDVSAPWELAKKKSCRKQLKNVICDLLEGLRVISGLIFPVMPQTSELMQKHLGLDPATNHYYHLSVMRRWNLIPGGTVLPKSITLFPRIDLKKATAATESDDVETELNIKPEITMDDFAKVDLRVAKIIRAERIPRARKLLKLEVDMGDRRTIVAGLAEHYEPDALIGKQVVIVANLKPAKLMGIFSKGMLLAATDDQGCQVLTLEREAKPGTLLR